MQLNEKIYTGKLLEDKQLPAGVLARAKYILTDLDTPNHNKRIYERKVFDKVLADPEIQEKLKNRNMWVGPEHPESTTLPGDKIAGIITEIYIDEEANKVIGIFEVADTVYGRHVAALLKANMGIGVSTRAQGDLVESEMEFEGKKGKYFKVVAESYQFAGADFTSDPSNKSSNQPKEVQLGMVKEIEQEMKENKLERSSALILLESLSVEEAKGLVENINKAIAHKCSYGACQGCGCNNEAKEEKLANGFIVGQVVLTPEGQGIVVKGVFTPYSDTEVTVSLPKGNVRFNKNEVKLLVESKLNEISEENIKRYSTDTLLDILSSLEKSDRKANPGNAKDIRLIKVELASREKNEAKIDSVKVGDIVTINGINSIVNQIFEKTGKVLVQAGIERKVVLLSECKKIKIEERKISEKITPKPLNDFLKESVNGLSSNMLIMAAHNPKNVKYVWFWDDKNQDIIGSFDVGSHHDNSFGEYSSKQDVIRGRIFELEGKTILIIYGLVASERLPKEEEIRNIYLKISNIYSKNIDYVVDETGKEVDPSILEKKISEDKLDDNESISEDNQPSILKPGTPVVVNGKPGLFMHKISENTGRVQFEDASEELDISECRVVSLTEAKKILSSFKFQESCKFFNRSQRLDNESLRKEYLEKAIKALCEGVTCCEAGELVAPENIGYKFHFDEPNPTKIIFWYNFWTKELVIEDVISHKEFKHSDQYLGKGNGWIRGRVGKIDGKSLAMIYLEDFPRGRIPTEVADDLFNQLLNKYDDNIIALVDETGHKLHESHYKDIPERGFYKIDGAELYVDSFDDGFVYIVKNDGKEDRISLEEFNKMDAIKENKAQSKMFYSKEQAEKFVSHLEKQGVKGQKEIKGDDDNGWYVYTNYEAKVNEEKYEAGEEFFITKKAKPSLKKGDILKHAGYKVKVKAEDEYPIGTPGHWVMVMESINEDFADEHGIADAKPEDLPKDEDQNKELDNKETITYEQVIEAVPPLKDFDKNSIQAGIIDELAEHSIIIGNEPVVLGDIILSHLKKNKDYYEILEILGL